MPQFLLDYLKDLLAFANKKGKPGTSPGDRHVRNKCIAHLIKLAAGFGFNPTRSDASKNKDGGPSGCSIVRDELEQVGIHLSEKGVEKIWNNLG